MQVFCIETLSFIFRVASKKSYSKITFLMKGSTVTEQVIAKAEGALSLFLKQNKNGQVDSVVPIQWCISRETGEMLQAESAEEPFLLIAISNGGKEMDRRLVPLTDEMCYLNFHRPGENVIHATIVWMKGESDGSPKKVFNKRFDDGEFMTQILTDENPRESKLRQRRNEIWDEQRMLDSDSEEAAALRSEEDQIDAELADLYGAETSFFGIRNDFNAVSQLGEEIQLGVVVPEDMFAKNPPRWMQWLGNFYNWEKAAVDQCHLRKRALITLSTLPFVLTAKLLFYIVAGGIMQLGNLVMLGLALLCTARDINYEPFRHPISCRPTDIWDGVKNSYWFDKKVVKQEILNEGKENERTVEVVEYEERSPLFFIISPPLIAFLSIIGAVLYYFFDSMMFIYAGVGAAFVMAALFLVGSLFSPLFSPIKSYFDNRADERRRKQREASEKRAELLRHDLELLACDGRTRDVNVSSLPKSRRTVGLRFQETKAKVCRPFAR